MKPKLFFLIKDNNINILLYLLHSFQRKEIELDSQIEKNLLR